MDKIIFFDGVCNLCNWSVRFVLNRDKKRIFYFSTLQSNYARQHLMHINGQYIKYDTVIYQEDGVLFFKSDAVLKILKGLGGIWSWFLLLKIIPRPLRDKLYDFIANHRFKWFGRKEHCVVPDTEVQSRFLD